MAALAAAAHGNAPLLLGLVLAAAFTALVPLLPASARRRYLPVISLAAAAAYYRRDAAGFALDAAVAYAAVRWLAAHHSPASRWRRACLLIAALAVVFTAGRIGRGSPLLFALDMWLVLRLVTLVWEVGAGVVPVPSVGGYVTWVCLPLTLLGPLLRYSEFTSGSPPQSPSSGWRLALVAGLAKMLAGTGLSALDIAVTAAAPQGDPSAAALRALVTGPLGFYLTFAGYFHAMQAFGTRAGIPLPDSFNWPIGRENIGEFWANWNMSATRVFRDYLFYNRWGRGSYNVFLNTLLLFTLMGLWHGAHAYWVIFGMLHGVLFCAFLLWRRYRGRLTALPAGGTALGRAAARAVTYGAVCACWYLPGKIVVWFASL